MEPPIINPGQFVVDIYNIALLLGGFLAFGAIVYGAILYSVAAGNPSEQSEAKEWITQALVGLLLLFGAYLVLYTVDIRIPNNLGVMVLDPLPPPPPSPSSTIGECRGGCVGFSNILGVDCKDGAGCSADQRVVAKLNCLYTRTDPAPSLVVTEGMPPTVPHDSPGHYNGCSIDVVPLGGVPTGGTSCANVQKLQAVATQCGFTVNNEYTQCGGRASPKSTGNHLHMTGC